MNLGAFLLGKRRCFYWRLLVVGHIIDFWSSHWYEVITVERRRFTIQFHTAPLFRSLMLKCKRFRAAIIVSKESPLLFAPGHSQPVRFMAAASPWLDLFKSEKRCLNSTFTSSAHPIISGENHHPQNLKVQAPRYEPNVAPGASSPKWTGIQWHSQNSLHPDFWK